MKKIFFSICLMLLTITGFSNPTDSSFVETHYNNAFTGMTAENDNIKGKIDAERHYKKYKGAGTGTLITSLVSPLIGLIPAITCSASAPKLTNLGYPDETLFRNPEYYKGYTEKAKKIKKKKVWTNWGIGLGVNLAAILLISSAGN